ncbi:hypothetical protein QBC45DRAFT_46882 [Copromyces sp. CBS 386.78]|nr:hypothetical protein QBC45DRAFT_46882 [Copromyces sp. CBS 386.78]
MSYEHRCLMRRRLELYHDLLTEQLRPRIEAAAAATIEATTDQPVSDTDQYIDENPEDTDDTDDTDDSDEDLCEWEHAENQSSEESYARVTQWRCGLESNGIWEDDAPDLGENAEKGSDQVELEQQDGDEASTTTQVHHFEHAATGNAVDTSVRNSGGPLTPLSVAFALDHIAKIEGQGHMDDGKNTPSGPETTKREADNTARPQQMKSGSESSKGDSLNKFTTPPSSPCHESSVTASPVSINEGNNPTSLGQPNFSSHFQSIPTTSKLFQSARRSKSLPPLNLLPSHCPPTPPPDTSSSSASTYSPLDFTVTPAELKFFNKHIEQVAYMIRGMDYQFQMQEYRNEVRRENRRMRRRAEVEESLREIEWSNKVPAEEWSSVAGMDAAEWAEGTTKETEHQSWENDAVTPESNSGGLEGDQSADLKGQGVNEPLLYRQGQWGQTYGTDGREDDVDSVWPDGAGEDDGCEIGWDSAWSSTQLELQEKIQLHQPTKPSPLRKGHTPDDMVWEDAVAEAEYLSCYGHQSKKDERGRRYWRL